MATQTGNPYETFDAADTGDPSPLLETTFTASHQMVDLGKDMAGNPITAHAETFENGIPGPTIRVNAGDSFVVRLKNELDHATGIHWHGIEMANAKDGTPFTQKSVEQHHTYLYKLRAPRAGLFWYHPHHHTSTNQTFRGLYGPIVVKDEALEKTLIDDPIQLGLPPIIPGSADTLLLVLSDTTVCKQPGPNAQVPNDTETYPQPSTWSWAGPAGPQPGPTPMDLCELKPLDDHGDVMNPITPFLEGDIPNIQPAAPVTFPGRVNEGQTVLTNGIRVDHRTGDPTNPDALSPNATTTYDVKSGQGLRLQIFNCATTRYFRLKLTTNGGAPVDLFRIGGEGGLLKHPILETDLAILTIPTAFTQGEILLPAGSRADVVAAIPGGLQNGEVLTLWTLDYPRLGSGSSQGPWCKLPTVPVAHFKINGSVQPAWTISEQTDLRPNGPQLIDLSTVPQPASLLDPANFPFSPPKPGAPSDLDTIDLQAGGGQTSIDGESALHAEMDPYWKSAHIASARYAEAGGVLELFVHNDTQAHHPFHLHGFSIQPLALIHETDATKNYDWPFVEYRDNVDVPPDYTLKFRVHLTPRPLVDDATPGGAMGRWLFHCHIFFHAHLGMMSELVITDGSGWEKPNVDVFGSWAYSDINNFSAERRGTYGHPDGLPVTLTVTDSAGTTGIISHILNQYSDGTWDWQGMGPTGVYYVYVTATDDVFHYCDQTVFRVRFGGTDDGADNGDPHIHTMNGGRYDFQAAGEFTLLRDLEEGLEIQGRQTPVRAANPVTDWVTGLRSCVSVNTAVAARVGDHRISVQPWRDPKHLQLFLDGKPAEVPRRGLDLGEHRLTTEPLAGGGMTVRVDYAYGAVLVITPFFWDTYGVWVLNVSVTHTQADEGIMGPIPSGTWLPALRGGGTVGPMPASLHDRWVTLYRTFADSWRITNRTSLFVYEAGTSTETFTDRDWPAEEPPCKLRPQFEIPGAQPPEKGLTPQQAEKVCRRVTNEGLHQDCVFDVASTGDVKFAAAYEVAQELRERATKVGIGTGKRRTGPGEEVVVTAVVANLYRDANESPRGKVTFFVDERKAGTAKIDDHGRATIVLRHLDVGEHRIRAEYAPTRACGRKASSSANRMHAVVAECEPQPQPKEEPQHTH